MRKFFIKQRRAFAVGYVVTHGERLRALRAARTGIDADIWPEDAQAFDEQIDALERSVQKRLKYLKTTPAY